jgi:hypothetical protein
MEPEVHYLVHKIPLSEPIQGILNTAHIPLLTPVVTCLIGYARVFGLMTGFIGLFDTARDYTLQFSVNTLVTTITSSLSSLYMVAASNGARSTSPSSGFPNGPRASPKLLTAAAHND